MPSNNNNNRGDAIRGWTSGWDAVIENDNIPARQMEQEIDGIPPAVTGNDSTTVFLSAGGPVAVDYEAYENIPNSYRQAMTRASRVWSQPVVQEIQEVPESSLWAVPATPARRTSPRPVAVRQPDPEPAIDYARVDAFAAQHIREYYGVSGHLHCRIENIPLLESTDIVYQFTVDGCEEPLLIGFRLVWNGSSPRTRRLRGTQLSHDAYSDDDYLGRLRQRHGYSLSIEKVRQFHTALRAARYKLMAKQFALGSPECQLYLYGMLDSDEMRDKLAPAAYRRQFIKERRITKAKDRSRQVGNKHLDKLEAEGVQVASTPQTDRGSRARMAHNRHRRGEDREI